MADSTISKIKKENLNNAGHHSCIFYLPFKSDGYCYENGTAVKN